MTKNHLYDKVQASQSFHALDPVFSLTRPAAVPTAHDSPLLSCLISPPRSECDILSPLLSQTSLSCLWFILLILQDNPKVTSLEKVSAQWFPQAPPPAPNQTRQGSFLHASQQWPKLKAIVSPTFSLLPFQPRKSKPACVFHLCIHSTGCIAGIQ